MKKKFKLAKLVRDNIVPLTIRNGSSPKYRKLSNKEYKIELILKLREEITEVSPDLGREELLQELADINEVLKYLMGVLKIDNETLQKIQRKKTRKVGGFDKKHYIDYIDCDENDPWFKYYAKNPNKFPEIK